MYYTELNHRKLFFDGDSSYNSNEIILLQNKYNINWVDELTPIIKKYNKLLDEHKQIKVKTTCNLWDTSWNLPDKYKKLSIQDYLFDKHIELTIGLSTKEIEKRDCRLISELTKYQELNQISLLRTIIYIVDILTEQDIVYGVGRGSSVSSYVLYVIGIHDVDSYYYDLDINDFFHD